MIQIRVEKMAYIRSDADIAQLGFAEIHGERRFSITIGRYEADSISAFLAGTKLPRPLTHDLLKNVIETLEAALIKVAIMDMESGLFKTLLYLQKGIDVITLEARTSDAVALMLRCDAPLFIEEKLLAKIAHKPEEVQPSLEELVANGVAYHSLETPVLQELLNKMLREENYEAAVEIRDILKSREQS